MSRIIRLGLFKWEWRADVPSLIKGRPARYEMGMGPYKTRRGAERDMKKTLKYLGVEHA